MSQALYRKWRPARFDDVIGQEHITRTLRNALTSGRSGHAYLFCGPRGTGKTTTARLLAKAVNCQHEDLSERPCNQCASCRAIAEGRFLDLIEIDAASNTGVDDIRDLRDKINFSPSEGRFKVYIIDEVHMLSTAAFNALLKTLEEPPPHAKFVLATTEEHKVPMTIKSRCQQFNFRLLTLPEISSRLSWIAAQEQLSVEPAALDLIARQGAGSIRDAESLLDQLVAAPGDAITLERTQMVLGTASSQVVSDLVDAWLDADASTGLNTIHQALASGADVRQFARQMVEYLRNLLLLQAAGDSAPLNLPGDERQHLMAQSARASRENLIDAVKAFNGAALASSSSWQPQLPLEMAFIRLLPDKAPTASVQPAAGRPLTPRAETQQVAQSQAQTPVKNRERQPAPSLEESSSRSQQPAPPASTEAPAAKAEVQAATDTQSETGSQPLPSRKKATDTAPQPIDLTAVRARWDAMVERVGQHDRNLPALLAICTPVGVEGNAIVLGFDYGVLKDKFEARTESRELVAETLSQLLGVKCIVRCVLTAQYTPPPEQQSSPPPQPPSTAAQADTTPETPTPAESGPDAAEGPGAPGTAATGVDKADFYALAAELGGQVRES